MESGSGQGNSILLVIDSRLSDVFLVGLAVRGICQYTPLGADGANLLEISVVEAVNNAVKHAYGGMPGNEVRVSVTLFPDRVAVAVSDAGETMEMTEPTKPACEISDPATLPESGRGLFIIRCTMDQVDYRTENGWNTLTMVKLFDAPKDKQA